LSVLGIAGIEPEKEVIMMKSYLLLILAVVVLLVTSPIRDVPAAKKVDDMQAVAGGNNKFAEGLYCELKKSKGNLFFSPYSISTALAMTYAGARGETKTQMANVMHFDLNQQQFHEGIAQLQGELNEAGKKGAFELNVANALWVQEGYKLLKGYLSLLEEQYKAKPHEADFVKATEEARRKINSWVEEKTNGKIKDLIKPGVLSALTRLVLTNAIYFKGKWASQFEKGQTSDAEFTLVGKEKVKVPLMSQKGNFRYLEREDIQALELPYTGDALSMLVLLPKKAGEIGKLEELLTLDILDKWIADLRKAEVMVYMPRFKMTSEFGLADTLKKMGMKDAFSLPPADFSGMTGKKDLLISAVIHKAFVDVNEEGTEAAAATGVVMRMEAVPTRPVVFRADHPFLFLIRDTRSGAILFLGRLMNPKE
jgi:serpin B